MNFTQFSLLQTLDIMMIFQVFLEFVLSVSIKQYIFLGKVRNFIRSKVNVVFVNSSDFTRFDSIFRFFSLVIYDPVYVEILNATHDCFDKVQWHLAFAIFVSSQNSPNLCQQNLLLLCAGFHEAKVQAQLRHFGASKATIFFSKLKKLKMVDSLVKI